MPSSTWPPSPGQMVALGSHIAAVVMASEDDLAQQIRDAGASVGERFWPMPLPDALRASLKSRVADQKNIGEQMGGMLVAGLFLQAFVPEGQAWAHRTSQVLPGTTAPPRLHTSGGTGFAARTLIGLARG